MCPSHIAAEQQGAQKGIAKIRALLSTFVLSMTLPKTYTDALSALHLPLHQASMHTGSDQMYPPMQDLSSDLPCFSAASTSQHTVGLAFPAWGRLSG